MPDRKLLVCTVNYFLHATGRRTEKVDLHVSELTRMLSTSGLAEPAFELAVLYTDHTSSRDRVLRSDFAEWLCLDIRTQRRIVEHSQAAVAA